MRRASGTMHSVPPESSAGQISNRLASKLGEAIWELRSAGLMLRARMAACVRLFNARQGSRQPLGSPVDPEVKIR